MGNRVAHPFSRFVNIDTLGVRAPFNQLHSLIMDNSIENSSIGVIGGGQLAQMLVKAGFQRNLVVAVQSGSLVDPAAIKSRSFVMADSNDVEGSRKLAKGCFGITFENEWIDISSLRTLEAEGVVFRPSLNAIEPLVDKLSQRKLLRELGIPSPSWVMLSSIDLKKPKLPCGWDFPVMAKAGTGGYDGKGTIILEHIDDLKKLLNSVDISNWFLDSWVDFERELAVVVSRDIDGKIRSFPLVETHQYKQVCDWVLAPAELSHSIEVMAYNIASSIVTRLDYIGVLAIEFFYGPFGLQVNEIAPRTHNSAHYSIEACTSSQFDQQLCITAGLPVPSPKLTSRGALMVNLLGLPSSHSLPLEKRLEKLKSIDSINLHWYGKENESIGRKLGHVTFLLSEENSNNRRDEALAFLQKVRSIWPIVE